MAHVSHGHAAHDHDHDRHGHARAALIPAPAAAPGASLLRASAAARLGGAIVAVAAVWAGVAWVLS